VLASQLTVTLCAASTVRRSRLRGVNLLRGRQHADTTLVMDHAVPHARAASCSSAVIDGEGRTGVFQGKIIVRPHAQKTDASMMSHALLLSDDARP
jgi:Fe-S cluster assembly protein SufD